MRNTLRALPELLLGVSCAAEAAWPALVAASMPQYLEGLRGLELRV